MAGLGVYARKTWEKYRKDAESAKARKRREKNVADRSAAEKKIIQWRKDREEEERKKYVNDFDFGKSIDEDAPPRERKAIVGSDGKVRFFTPPIDLRTTEKKQQALQNKVNAKYGRQK
tara:strand:+ start:809 stop:1162 length:354 start_codon:yes stop_codon:yes gene_type:complete